MEAIKVEGELLSDERIQVTREINKALLHGKSPPKVHHQWVEAANKMESDIGKLKSESESWTPSNRRDLRQHLRSMFNEGVDLLKKSPLDLDGLYYKLLVSINPKSGNSVREALEIIISIKRSRAFYVQIEKSPEAGMEERKAVESLIASEEQEKFPKNEADVVATPFPSERKLKTVMGKIEELNLHENIAKAVGVAAGRKTVEKSSVDYQAEPEATQFSSMPAIQGTSTSTDGNAETQLLPLGKRNEAMSIVAFRSKELNPDLRGEVEQNSECEIIQIPAGTESLSIVHEGIMSVPGVEVPTTVSSETGHQLAEIAINEKEGKCNESRQIDQPIMSITTSTEGLMKLEFFILPPARASEKIVMHKINADCPLLSFSLRESDYSVFSRKNENVEEPVKPEENEGKNFDGDGSSSILLERQNGTNFSFPKDYVLGICNAELREPPAEGKWGRPSLIVLTRNKFSSLPEKPNCPNLQCLFLQHNTWLRKIPDSFFDNMPKLQFLDMSKTGVRSLPTSLSKLSELKALFLRDCNNIDELPVEIGNLEHIEVLDLGGTQLLKLPDEISKLSHLRLLRVSFYGADEDSEYPKLHPLLVSPGVISKLRALQALSIAVRPGDGRWNDCADAITDEVGCLGELTYLQFYFPEVKFLALFMQKSSSWRRGLLSKFKFVLGQDIERVVSRVPDDVISEYEKHDQCLRYVNGDEKIPQELEELLVRITAFYLDHHCMVKSLSEFGLTNLKELKFCVLSECPNIVNIINNVRKTDGLLPHLEHLSMHYLSGLEGIWKGVVPPGSLDGLKLLSVCKCPKLKFILTESMLQCLSNLEELIVEDCESVKVIIETKGKRIKAGTILPSLKKMRLSYLPKLVMLWNGVHPTFEPIVRGCPLFKSST